MLQQLNAISKGLLSTVLRSTAYRRIHHESCGIAISMEVKEALSSCQPVVALESTIITHGMPYPQNFETAVKVEDIIRKEGAVPATIAVIKGQIYAGLTCEQLHFLASKKDQCVKISRRDFPYVLAKGISGGTTVSGTMMVAQKIGIPIFVTGGIGGVHRGVECTLDISADLTELGRTPVTVVSAGVKSILDVCKTLEYLETQGVCVTVLGPDPRFPDFFTRESSYSAPCHIESPVVAALMMKKRAELKINSGILIAVPIPQEHEAEGKQIKDAIEEAVKEAELAVSGRDVTPYILQRVHEITGGQSLKANVALIENNAKIGTQIAVEYSKLRTSSSSCAFPGYCPTKKNEASEVQEKPVVIGGSIVDFVATVMEPEIKEILLQKHVQTMKPEPVLLASK
nr:pseudouridine-5'-phosphate glycosidase-like isoform X2 [Cherax quadricarinatus]